MMRGIKRSRAVWCGGLWLISALGCTRGAELEQAGASAAASANATPAAPAAASNGSDYRLVWAGEVVERLAGNRSAAALFDKHGGQLADDVTGCTVQVGALAAGSDARLTVERTRPARGSISPIWRLALVAGTQPPALDLTLTCGSLRQPLIAASELRIARQVAGQWQPVAGRWDQAAGTVTASVSEAGEYALVATADAMPAMSDAVVGTVVEAGGVRLESSREVELWLEVSPLTIQYGVRGQASKPRATRLKLTGLRPNARVWLYRDSLQNGTRLRADAEGSLQLAQPISTESTIGWLQPWPSTYFIDASLPDGGDCALIGGWDLALQQCTLSGDVYESIEIVSPDTRLDCAGFVVNGQGAGVGVLVGQAADTGASVVNCHVSGFAYGIQTIWASSTLIADNVLSDNTTTAILLGGTSDVVSRNTIRGAGTAVMTRSRYAQISDNTITGSGVGVDVWAGIINCNTTDGTVVTGNSIEGSYTHGVRLTGPFGESGIIVSGNTISSTSLPRAGTAIHTFPPCGADGAEVTSNTLSGFARGVSLFDCRSCVVSRNVISSCDTGIEFGNYANRVFLNDIHSNDLGATGNAPIQIWDTDPTSPTYMHGNYWGRTCPNGPYFVAGVDSNASDVVDSYPFGLPVAQLASPPPPDGCAVADQDSDGYISVDYGGNDCDDTNPHCTTDCTDADGDGYCIGFDCDDGCSLVTTTCSDFDGDGIDDACDPDDDNDTVIDVMDGCPRGETGWTSTPATDLDGDGCRDAGEDTDDDGDGFVDQAHGGNDCNDRDPAVFPGAREICDAIDSDCDGSLVNAFFDNDADGTPDCVDPDDDNDGIGDASDPCPFDVTGPCAQDPDGDGFSNALEGAGSRLDPNTYPGAEELCDGRNNDGDALVDEGTGCEVCP